MRQLLLLLIGLLTTSCASAPEAASVANPPAPARSAPSLVMLADRPPLGDEWLEGWIGYSGFPASSEDGTVVIDARRDNDGGRGYPNLRIEAFAVADGRTVFESVIVDADADIGYTLEAPLPAARLAAMRAAFDKARRYLAGRRWHTLGELIAPDHALEDVVPYFSDDGSLAVLLSEPDLIVDLASESRIYTRNVSAWSAPPNHAGCSDELAPAEETLSAEDCFCYNPAGASRVWADLPRGIAVVEVSYIGTDSCWEPEPRLLPFHLPTRDPRDWSRGPRSADTMGLARDRNGLPAVISDATDLDALRAFLTRWERRFPESPDVKAARQLLDRQPTP